MSQDNNGLSRTICIKTVGGEDIFAELLEDDESKAKGIMKLYQPYVVKVLNTPEGMRMILSPWQLFTDDMVYYMNAEHVLSINSIDDHHLRMYGAMVSNSELKMIQSEMAKEVRNGTITGTYIEDALKSTFIVIMKSGLKYGIPMPEKEQVKTDFYSFLMGQYDNDLTVLH